MVFYLRNIYTEKRQDILEKLQFIADSGWDIMKGALSAKRVIADSNGINGDIEIVPIFDGFHDEVELYYCHENKKNISPIGDLWHLIQDDMEIRFGLTLPKRKEERLRGEHTGEYLVLRKHNPHSDHFEAIQKRGYHFEYDSDKRMFIPENGGKESWKQ